MQEVFYRNFGCKLLLLKALHLFAPLPRLGFLTRFHAMDRVGGSTCEP